MEIEDASEGVGKVIMGDPDVGRWGYEAGDGYSGRAICCPCNEWIRASGVQGYRVYRWSADAQ